MFVKTKGVVLHETDYQDRDKLLTVLTEDLGKITLRARGIKGTRNTMKASCQLMAYSEMTILRQGGRYILSEANSIALFSELQGDIELLSLGSYFLQVAEFAAQEDDPSPELLSLLLNSLYALGTLQLPQLFVKAVFELRLCCILGFRPILGNCPCGVGEVAYFSLGDGSLLCRRCKEVQHTTDIRLPIAPGTLDALRYIASCPPGKLFSFRLGKEAVNQLSGITEAYLCARLERGFFTLDFYKSLQIEGLL